MAVTTEYWHSLSKHWGVMSVSKIQSGEIWSLFLTQRKIFFHKIWNSLLLSTECHSPVLFKEQALLCNLIISFSSAKVTFQWALSWDTVSSQPLLNTSCSKVFLNKFPFTLFIKKMNLANSLAVWLMSQLKKSYFWPHLSPSKIYDHVMFYPSWCRVFESWLKRRLERCSCPLLDVFYLTFRTISKPGPGFFSVHYRVNPTRLHLHVWEVETIGLWQTT